MSDPILFCDFDGVVNASDTIDEARRRGEQNAAITPEEAAAIATAPPIVWTRFVPEHYRDAALAFDLRQIGACHVQHLQRVVDLTGARVVVSSTWRLSHTIWGLRWLLGARGFTGEIIGATPDLSGVYQGSKILRGVERGTEIQAWLDANEHGPIAIVDDDGGMLHLTPKLVRTDFETGLCERHVAPLVALLKGES